MYAQQDENSNPNIIHQQQMYAARMKRYQQENDMNFQYKAQDPSFFDHKPQKSFDFQVQRASLGKAAST